MSRAWLTARVLAVLLGGPVALYLIFRWLGEHARWSGYSPDKQQRIRADERRRRALGEPDHFDVLDEPEPLARRLSRLGSSGYIRVDDESPLFWRHQPVPGGITHLARRGEPCGSCGAEEPA